VKELENSGGVDDWTRIFPNIQKLSCVVDDRRLMKVLNDFKHVEHLSLTIVTTGNVNSLLSGMCQCHCQCEPPLDDLEQEDDTPKATDDEEEEHDDVRTLVQFTNLKTLKLEGIKKDYFFSRDEEPNSTIIRDSGVSRCLLQLHPLESLTIIGHDISEEYQQKLKTRHQNVILRKLPDDEEDCDLPPDSESDSCEDLYSDSGSGSDLETDEESDDAKYFDSGSGSDSSFF